ncbi:phage holin family protein [Streptomyces sp. ST2-7A]|uniref:phage holin family protein n=1 Tax=Streptomyces sp. ST2-7A TaxID=2907214 RepID=UPI001F3D7B1C|nr:phage holin family protein [Streptomyces sp. ST2-7A]MCE7081642.1 phage holin family protein [Streptomyces sp. ST2-7A]
MREAVRRGLAGALLRGLTVWAVGTLTLIVLAALLPRLRLQHPEDDSPTGMGVTAALAAAVFGVLGALIWPWLVRALLLVPALALGLLVFLLNGSLLWLALTLLPQNRGEVGTGTAVVVAAVLSAATSATGTGLATRDPRVLRRRLRRMAGLRGRDRRPTGSAADTVPAGFVFLQLDGVGHEILREAVAGPEPLMPTVARLCADSHRVLPWHTDWQSQTGAAQLGILHGSNHDVPAFRWYEKETGTLMVSNRPSSAVEMQRRARERTGSPGLLADGGASRGNLFTGGAEQSALVLSVAGRQSFGRRSRAGYFAYFSDPAHAVRTAGSFVVEVGREVVQALRSRVRGDHPRVPRGGLYPFVRAFATVVQRDVVLASVLGDVLTGRRAVYADLVAYDEVAHHSGPRSPDVRKVLARLDRCVELIERAIEHAPRPYHLVLLSDHGQSHGETFEAAYGMRLEALVRAGCGAPVPRERRPRHESGAEALGAVRVALHRPEEGAETERAGHVRARAARGRGNPPVTATPGRRSPTVGSPGPVAPTVRPGADPVVLGSGNLGLVSLPDLPGRATRQRIDAAHPALLPLLAGHPGIGFVLVEDERHGPVVLGRGGEHRLVDGTILGNDPLAPFGPHAAGRVLRTARFPHAPDIMVNSAVDPATGAVHAFEQQIGSHGGLGGEQCRAFLLVPRDLGDPTGAGDGSETGNTGELVGAEAVHRVFRRWLEEAARSGPAADGNADGPPGPRGGDPAGRAAS